MAEKTIPFTQDDIERIIERQPDGEILQIRRAETVDDHFGTLDFGALERFRA